MKENWNISFPKVMALPLLFIVFLCNNFSSFSQECPPLLSPTNGATMVPVDSPITWEAVAGVPGYIISLGTTEGGNDILNERNVGAATTFTPTTGLPENTEIFVTITLFFFNQPNIICDSQSFTTASLTDVPDCVPASIPANNAINVNTGTNISWNAATNATGYFLSIGTTLNGSDLLASTDIGNELSYNPPTDLPSETDIYITILPYNRIGVAMGCSTVSFTTAAAAVLPVCTSMISPFDGETNVPLSPTLEWNAVPNATGYKVSIGTSPFETNILEDAILFNTSAVVIDFEPNRTFFISIVPFNEAGEAIGCTQETFSTLLGCGPYYDPTSGDLVVLNPELTLPDSISICEGNSSNRIAATDEADGYRWYKLDDRGNETLLATTEEVVIDEEGEYLYEAYINIEDSGRIVECASSKTFNVVTSQAPKIEDVEVQINANSLDYTIRTTTKGNYEYALDDEDGPYQDSNRFANISLENHTVFVRDKGGCGISDYLVQQDFTVNGFPNFFTPNGDGINDYWQFIPPTEMKENSILVIHIFDRFGALLAQINPNTDGWNGNLNGNQLPESEYWFRARLLNEQEITGHFTLKR